MENVLFTEEIVIKMEIEPSVELKKGGLERYRLIYKWKNQDGSINWFNFLTGGSWANLIKVILVVAFLVLLVVFYKHDTAVLLECCNNACKAIVDTQVPVVVPGFP